MGEGERLASLLWESLLRASAGMEEMWLGHRQSLVGCYATPSLNLHWVELPSSSGG